jgi:hypothetical protein
MKDLNLAKKLAPVFTEILKERNLQNDKFGEQNHLMNTKFFDCEFCKTKERFYKEINKKEDFRYSWLTILLEEVYEAFSVKTPKKQRAEMIQVAAVAIAIIECLDRVIEKRNAK